VLPRTSKSPDLSLSTAFLEKAAHWALIRDARNGDLEELRAQETGASLARNPDDAESDRCSAARAIAGSFFDLARRRPEEVQASIRTLRRKIEDETLPYIREYDAWNMARRRETDRLAKLFEPKHRAAVEMIADALEALTAAIEAERSVRGELARVAPEPDSRFLPVLSPDIGILTDLNSTAAGWARYARQLGYLK
jgi:hypothetical protein